MSESENNLNRVGVVDRDQAIRGGLWSGVERFADQIVQFIVQLVLARLLLPEDFGLIAMVIVVVQIASVFVRAGFGMGIVQRQSLDEAYISTAFWLNVAMAMLMYLVLYAAAPCIAGFYEHTQLTPLIRVLSLNLIAGAVTNLQVSLLQRNLQFKHLFLCTMPGKLISACLSIWAALSGWGAWALVVHLMSGTILNILLLWKISLWKPSLVFHIISLKSLLAFGLPIVATQFMEQLFRHASTAVVGALYSSGQLGFYNRAQAIQQMPTFLLINVVGRVAMPVFARCQDDKSRLLNGFSQGVQLLVGISAPAMVGLAVLAEPLVCLLLTDKWIDSVPLLQVFCLLGIIIPVHELTNKLLLGAGNSRGLFRINLVRSLISIGTLILTVQQGVYAIVVGQVIGTYLGLLVNHFWLKEFGYTMGALLRDTLPSSFAAIGMGALVYYVASRIDLLLPKIGLSLLIGCSAYALISWLLGSLWWKFSCDALLALSPKKRST